MYYRPGADSAYESVRFIISDVTFGWLVRALHSWSANLMILMAFLHMFTVYFTQAYRKPREMTWLTGIGLLGLVLVFGFSGYLLPWNELSFFATRVGTGMVRAIPILGDYLMVVLRGGEEVTGATIGRFFGLHVAIMPALFSMMLTVHLLFVQRQGMSEPFSWQEKETQSKRFMNFFPNFLYRDLLLWLVALNVLALLAVLFPDGVGVVHWPLGEKADPFSPPPEVIRPEWYFMFAFQTLKLIPGRVLFMEGELFGITGAVGGGYSLGTGSVSRPLVSAWSPIASVGGIRSGCCNVHSCHDHIGVRHQMRVSRTIILCLFIWAIMPCNCPIRCKLPINALAVIRR